MKYLLVFAFLTLTACGPSSVSKSDAKSSSQAVFVSGETYSLDCNNCVCDAETNACSCELAMCLFVPPGE